TVNFAAGTYFFYNAKIDFSGTVNGTNVTLVLLGNSSLSIGSSAIVNLSAPTNNATYPALSGVLIDDQASGSVTVNGSSTVTLNGTMYFPNADVTWNGTTGNINTTCTAVYAKTLTIGGNAFMNTKNCVQDTIAHTQVVALVQ